MAFFFFCGSVRQICAFIVGEYEKMNSKHRKGVPFPYFRPLRPAARRLKIACWEVSQTLFAGRKERGMSGRKRTVQIKFRVTEEERALIEQKMKLVPTRNMESYLRKMAIDGYIIQIDHSRDMSVKTKTAKYLKFQRGEYQSKICPYGYRKGENGRMVPDPETSEVVQKIFEYAVNGMNAADIARELSRQQIPTPGEHKARKGIKTHDVSRTHGMWCNSTVLRILADERYMGTYVIGKREVTEIGGHKMRSKAESDWIKIPNHHIPLVNEEIFSKANASIQRFKIPNRKKHNYLLRGKVICGCCKHALHLANGTSYRCRFSSTIPSLDCYNIHIREKELNQLVYELLCKQFQVAFGVDSLADLRKVDTVALRQADFDRQIFELQEEKRKLYESLVSGGIPLPKYKEQKEQISERLLEVQNTKAVVMARLEAEQEERQHQRQKMDISRMLTESDGLTSELVDLLIDKIYVYPDKRVDIAFKIRDSFTTHD